MSDETPGEDVLKERFSALQERLLPVWRALETGSQAAYTSIVVPSLSFDQEELAKIQGASFYEERLLFSLIRLRDPRATVIYLTSLPVHPEIVDYYLSLLRGVSARSARDRLHLLRLYDAGPKALTEKILERPRIIQRIRDLIRDPAHAYLTCFNASELERRLALELGVPLNGLDPDLLWLGTKSGSRRVFDEAEVSQTPGFCDLESKSDLLQALEELRTGNPSISKAVVKLNESFAGAGNALFGYPSPDSGNTDRSLENCLEDLQWTSRTENLDDYLRKFSVMGGIAEEFVEIEDLRSPSAQLRVNPDGSVTLLSTHDQVLGGATGQTYLGCRFPADERYRQLIGSEGRKVAEVLRGYGVVSRFAVDFLVHPAEGGGWNCLAVEINLRMGGTTHPFMALQFLTNGQLDDSTGLFVSSRGVAKYYYATDNLRSPIYRGLLPEDFMDILASHGLDFDPSVQKGVVFHMIGALSQFGKVGVTCIGDTAEEADEIYHRVVEVLDLEGSGSVARDPANLHPFELASARME